MGRVTESEEDLRRRNQQLTEEAEKLRKELELLRADAAAGYRNTDMYLRYAAEWRDYAVRLEQYYESLLNGNVPGPAPVMVSARPLLSTLGKGDMADGCLHNVQGRPMMEAEPEKAVSPPWRSHPMDSPSPSGYQPHPAASPYAFINKKNGTSSKEQRPVKERWR